MYIYIYIYTQQFAKNEIRLAVKNKQHVVGRRVLVSWLCYIGLMAEMLPDCQYTGLHAYSRQHKLPLRKQQHGEIIKLCSRGDTNLCATALI